MIHFVDEGPRDAPAVIFSHSLGHDHTLWSGQAAALRDRFRVVRYDARGHGRSPAPPGPWSMGDFAGDVLALADRLELERFHHVGLSLGGQVSLWLAANAAPRVRRVVVANSAARIGTAEGWDARVAALTGGGEDAVFDAVVERSLTAPFRARDPEAAARLRARIATSPREGYLAACAALRDSDLRGEVDRIRAPLLVIAGRHDASTTVDEARWLVERVAGARYVELDAAHLSNLEAAREFNEALFTFLNEESPTWTSATDTTKD